MSARLISAFLIVHLVHCVHLVHAENADALTAQVDALFEKWDKPDSPGASLAIIRDGAIIYKRGYGMANLDHDIPNDPSTVFHVASISKQFTAFCIALLQEEGKLSVNDDVRKYISELPDYGHKITIRHLIYHTSGVRDQWELLQLAGWRMEDIITQQDVLDLVLRQQELNFAPGEEYLYSNAGYTLLAEIVRRVSGKTLREFADERIFQPLGMTSTHFHDDHGEVVKNRAHAYTPATGGRFRINIPGFDTVGATSLFTTVEDMAKWDQNFYEKKIGSEETHRDIRFSGALNNGLAINYGYGISFFDYKGLPTLGHGGADAGYRSHYIQFPEQEFSVVILCNVPLNPQGIAMKIADLYLADQMKEEAPAGEGSEGELPKFSDDERERFEGTYRNPETRGIWRISSYQDELRASGLGITTPLVPAGDGRFQSDRPSPNFHIEFTLENGKASAAKLTWDHGRAESLEALAPPDPSANPDDFAGVYESQEVRAIYEIVKDGTKLKLRRIKNTDTVLQPRFKDQFTSALLTLEFERDASGAVNGMRVSGGRVRNVLFKKR